ncbi:MAG: phosphotransferase, partial [archaeon]
KTKLIHKIYTNKAGGITEKRLEIIKKISEKLRPQKLIIPVPQISLNNKYVNECEQIPVVTFSYVEGEICEKNPSDIKLAFETLTKIHKTLRYEKLEKQDFFSSPYTELFHKLKEQHSEYNGIYHKKISKILSLSEKFIEKNEKLINDASKGIIHGDFAIKHILKNKNDTGIIDWDYFNKGLLIHDLSRLFYDSLKRNTVPSSEIEKLMREYNNQINLNESDINLFPHMFEYRMLYRSLNISSKLINNPSQSLENFLDKTLYYLLEEQHEINNFKF